MESLLVVNANGVLKRYQIPIKVQCISEDSGLNTQKRYYVDCLTWTDELTLIYGINGKPYPASDFRILGYASGFTR